MGWLKECRAWHRKLAKMSIPELEALRDAETHRNTKSLIADKIRQRTEGLQLH